MKEQGTVHIMKIERRRTGARKTWLWFRHDLFLLRFFIILIGRNQPVDMGVLSFPISSYHKNFLSPHLKIARPSCAAALVTCQAGCNSHNLDFTNEIRTIAERLWGSCEKLETVLSPTIDTSNLTTFYSHGECPYPKEKSYMERGRYFEELAQQGDARAQHSLGLLLWNGFCAREGTSFCKNEVESAKWHAAAAAQNHLDGMAVLGGCLRTGTGVQRNVDLGLRLIEFSAHQGNPTGRNKKAALLEEASDYGGAFQLYQKGFDDGGINDPNALLLFNLGWCFMNGDGIKKDVRRGEYLWKEACQLAPDEGSEEAAWFLYEQHERDNPMEAQKWLQLAQNLGHEDALECH